MKLKIGDWKIHRGDKNAYLPFPDTFHRVTLLVFQLFIQRSNLIKCFSTYSDLIITLLRSSTVAHYDGSGIFFYTISFHGKKNRSEHI